MPVKWRRLQAVCLVARARPSRFVHIVHPVHAASCNHARKFSSLTIDGGWRGPVTWFRMQPVNSRTRLGALLFCGATAAAAFFGCAGQQYNAGAVAPVQHVTQGGFGWEGQSVEATGTARAPESLREPQRSIAGRRAAKTESIARLKEQVSALPVVNGQTLGHLMKDNLGLRHAVERYLQKAQVLNESTGAADNFEAHVRLPLAPLAEILQNYQITPESAPDMLPEESNVAPVS